MEHVIEFGVFFLKTAVILFAFIIALSYILSASLKAKAGDKSTLQMTNTSKKLKEREKELQVKFADPKQAKALKKEVKKQKKKNKKQATSEEKKRLFVLSFEGDIKASQTEDLKSEITYLLQAARPQDQVMLKLESPGGMVSGYGLAASELLRIKNAGLKLTVCVDKVAASGGYMMACVADEILTAPFAILGSIGVVAQLPNFHKLLKKNDIDYEVLTAGNYKRTLTVFGENTDKGRAKFVDQLEDIHQLFKNFVTQNRPQVDIDQVATGEYWFGNQCVDLKLADGISTSEDFVFSKHKDFDIFEIRTRKKKSLVDMISEPVSKIVNEKLEQLLMWKGF
ncbi:MAG: protease SohB [Bdellovibrionaceae bacterium]|nr:protease SohB [Pseudobdellovibrionaceae bacterium]